LAVTRISVGPTGFTSATFGSPMLSRRYGAVVVSSALRETVRRRLPRASRPLSRPRSCETVVVVAGAVVGIVAGVWPAASCGASTAHSPNATAKAARARARGEGLCSCAISILLTTYGSIGIRVNGSLST
jgi:hypothetical protein